VEKVQEAARKMKVRLGPDLMSSWALEGKERKREGREEGGKEGCMISM
jgi:hypothetical protein